MLETARVRIKPFFEGLDRVVSLAEYVELLNIRDTDTAAAEKEILIGEIGQEIFNGIEITVDGEVVNEKT